MTFTMNLKQIHLEGALALKTLDQELGLILEEGTRAWVRAVVSAVPSWTGESRASIKPIADLVGVPVFISVSKTAPADRTARGAAQGSAKIIKSNGTFQFQWNSKVVHFAFNEVANANERLGLKLINPGPYQSQLKGLRAFFETVDPKLRAYRWRLSRFLRIKTLKV